MKIYLSVLIYQILLSLSKASYQNHCMWQKNLMKPYEIEMRFLVRDKQRVENVINCMKIFMMEDPKKCDIERLDFREVPHCQLALQLKDLPHVMATKGKQWWKKIEIFLPQVFQMYGGKSTFLCEKMPEYFQARLDGLWQKPHNNEPINQECARDYPMCQMMRRILGHTGDVMKPFIFDSDLYPISSANAMEESFRKIAYWLYEHDSKSQEIVTNCFFQYFQQVSLNLILCSYCRSELPP